LRKKNKTNPYEFDRYVAQSLFPGSPPLIWAGVDEAGRGPLAGPVVAAAVQLPLDPPIEGLRDSKVVPPEQREALYLEIMEEALSSAVSVIDPVEIDQLNIFRATMKAMRECLQALDPQPSVVLVDGNQKPQSGLREQALIKGDAKSASIMAASILAKVTRDQIMLDLHQQYPQYGFDEHKGYGAPKHLEAIEKYGPCPLHRRSFEPVKSLNQKVLIP